MSAAWSAGRPYPRRQLALGALLALVLVGLFGRTAYWQVAQHGLLASWADRQHLSTRPLASGRGMIVDANGTILALSVVEDSVIADPAVLRQRGALGHAATTLAALLSLPQATLLRQLDVPGEYVALRGLDGQPVLLPSERRAAVWQGLQNANLVGMVALLPVVRRVYPSGTLAAQVLGYVKADDGLGQYGIERQFNAALAGRPGSLTTAVDAKGNPLATLPQVQVPPVPGATIRLTLDATLQYWAEQGLAATVRQTGAAGGTVLAMDPATGAILAMASLPSFDPNAYWNAGASFPNPAVQAVYDPGSVMKAVTMAAGIDSGAITPQSTVYDTGTTVVEGITLHNFDGRGHGTETMTQVLQYSANVGAVWVAQHVGAARFDQYLRAFGFGTATGVDLPGEVQGVFAPPDAAQHVQLTLATHAFGESIAVTPLQMVEAYAALANGGAMMRPYIVAGVRSPGGVERQTQPQVVRQVVRPSTAQQVTQMLVDSARASEAQMWRLWGYQVAAKTGTSTPYPQDPYWTYASVIGYAPATHPRFVLLVKLDHPRTTVFGGEAAGPLWRSLAEQFFAYYNIAPNGNGG